MGKTVSVIVPNYNNEKYLQQCIESIFRQNYSDMEVIIVDDCSTDRSKDLLCKLQESYGKEKLRVILLDRNLGVSRARNIGLTAAKGEYFTTLDADDCFANEFKLSNEMELIERYKRKGEDVAAYSSVLYMNEGGVRLEDKGVKKCNNGNLFLLLLNTAETKIVPRDYCVKTEYAVAMGGWREDMSLYEDYEFTLRLSKQIKFVATQKDGTIYRLRKNGLSDKSRKESDKVFFQIFIDNIRLLPIPVRIKCVIIKILSYIKIRVKTEIYNWVVRWKK